MLSPDYLEHVPDRLVELYAQAETDIIADMARKINAYDYFSSASEWQAVKVHELGLTYEEILKKLSSLSGRTLSELKKLLEEAGVKTLSADDEIYRKAGLSPQSLKESKHLIAILNESLKKTNNTFKNLTSITAKEASGQFVEALDRAYMQIVTGGIDKNAAVRSAIQHLTENGLRSIKYPTRTDHLDAAVRRAVRTGVNQTAGRLQEARAEEMGCDLVETTAHDGARPSHETWQGKVFSRSGSSRKYPPFKESTGYGTVTGLMGANCRHSFYPFFEDSEPIYTKSELAGLNQPKYHYRGKDITEYEAVQRQRYHERQIRRWKREKEAMKAAGQPTDRAEARLRKWNRIQDDFLEQTGLKRQVDLEQIAKKVEKQSPHAEKTVEKIAGRSTIKSIDIDDLKAATYGKNIDSEVEDVIYQTIKSDERKGDLFISNVVIKNIAPTEKGIPILQVEPDQYGILQLNVNSAVIAGKSLAEIDAMFASSRNTLANTLEEAAKHECGHAKLIKGLNVKQIEELYSELEKIHVEGVSDIAYSDGAECIAEVEILLFRGEEVPEEAMKLYEKYIKR